MSEEQTTSLLKRAAEGDADALEELSPRVAPELRKIAVRLLQNEPPDQALQTTVLVDDVLLVLNAGKISAANMNKRYFYGAAARIMKRQLIDAARKRDARVRSASIASLSDVKEPADWYDVLAMVEIDEALDALAKANPNAFTAFFLVHLVRMSRAEVAERIDTTTDHVGNLIKLARMFLNNALRGR